MFLYYLIPYIVGVPSISEPISFSQVELFDPLNPVFTLTCVSTGGPATTVTWTRDGETVSYDDYHVLSQTVTDIMGSTCSNVLTVTGREPGSYQCAVANDRGSASSQPLTVQGKSSLVYIKHVQSLYIFILPLYLCFLQRLLHL